MWAYLFVLLVETTAFCIKEITMKMIKKKVENDVFIEEWKIP